MEWERIKADYRRMAKPRAIEEVGDIYLIRPLGFALVQMLRHTAITPTMVSALAVLAGWLCAWFYYVSERHGSVPALATLGAFAMLLHSALDSADGQLARLKNMHTPLGRIVDGFCDNLAFLAVYVAIVLGRWARTGEYDLEIALLATVAAVSHSLQSSLVDYQRTLYLQHVHGHGGFVESHPERLKRSNAHGVAAPILLLAHRVHYAQQRLLLRSTVGLERVLAQWRERHPSSLPMLASRYEAGHRPLLRYWALLASNSHKIGIVAAAFVPSGTGSLWGGLGMGWYLVYVLLLNLVLVALIPIQRRADGRLCAQLEQLEAGTPAA